MQKPIQIFSYNFKNTFLLLEIENKGAGKRYKYT